jgi:hypothetical protein
VSTWATAHGWSTTPTRLTADGLIAADGLVVEGTDTISAVSGACPTSSITIRGVPVALTNTTTYTSPVTCESLSVGTTVKVTAMLTFTATGFTVTATNVAPAGDDTGTGGGTETPPGSGTPGGGSGKGKKASGEGVIGSITGNCPTLTLVITGTKVSTTPTTTYEGGDCHALRPGTKVKIDGELNPGGTATAEKIEIKSIPAGNGGGSSKRVSGDGKVDTVAGTCPSLELSVRGVQVMTSSETTFSGGACSDVMSGSQIDVTGDYDGTKVVATALRIKKK